MDSAFPTLREFGSSAIRQFGNSGTRALGGRRGGDASFRPGRRSATKGKAQRVNTLCTMPFALFGIPPGREEAKGQEDFRGTWDLGTLHAPWSSTSAAERPSRIAELPNCRIPEFPSCRTPEFPTGPSAQGPYPSLRRSSPRHFKKPCPSSGGKGRLDTILANRTILLTEPFGSGEWYPINFSHHPGSTMFQGYGMRDARYGIQRGFGPQ